MIPKLFNTAGMNSTEKLWISKLCDLTGILLCKLKSYWKSELVEETFTYEKQHTANSTSELDNRITQKKNNSLLDVHTISLSNQYTSIPLPLLLVSSPDRILTNSPSVS